MMHYVFNFVMNHYLVKFIYGKIYFSIKNIPVLIFHNNLRLTVWKFIPNELIICNNTNPQKMIMDGLSVQKFAKPFS